MHLLEAWTSLGPFHLARLLALPAAMLVATLLPGRQLARGAALVSAVGVVLLSEMAVPWWVRGAWGALWIAIAWQSGIAERPTWPRGRPVAARSRPARWRCRSGSRCWR